MHELAITQSMLELVLGEAAKAETGKVQKINLTIGQMSGVVGECVESYFEFLSKDTIAEGAILSFNKIPMQAQCSACNKFFVPKEPNWSCPDCHNRQIEIIAGNELYVESIEVE